MNPPFRSTGLFRVKGGIAFTDEYLSNIEMFWDRNEKTIRISTIRQLFVRENYTILYSKNSRSVVDGCIFEKLLLLARFLVDCEK